MIEYIQYELIRSEDRIRKVDAVKVDALASSIEQVGILNPITVAHARVTSGSSEIDGYRVVAGSHRLAALMKLSFTEIPCLILDLNDQERVIAECDENLCVARLTPSDEALFTKRRKEAYLALHPETAAGQAQARAANAAQGKDVTANSAATSFAVDQATKTGKAERTVRQHAERGEAITEAALAIVSGTDLDTGVYLDKLKKIAPEKQEDRVRDDLAKAAEKAAAKEAAKNARPPAAPVDTADEPEPAPEPAKPSPYAGLTREALEEDLAGMTEDRDAARKEIAALKDEIERKDALIADLSNSNQGAMISKLDTQRLTFKGQLKDQMAKTKRIEYKLRAAEKERDEAIARLENQMIPL